MWGRGGGDARSSGGSRKSLLRLSEAYTAGISWLTGTYIAFIETEG